MDWFRGGGGGGARGSVRVVVDSVCGGGEVRSSLNVDIDDNDGPCSRRYVDEGLGMSLVGLLWPGLVWSDLVWYGMVWYGLLWSVDTETKVWRCLVAAGAARLVQGRQQRRSKGGASELSLIASAAVKMSG